MKLTPHQRIDKLIEAIVQRDNIIEARLRHLERVAAGILASIEADNLVMDQGKTLQKMLDLCDQIGDTNEKEG